MLQNDITFFKNRGFGKEIGMGNNPCLIVIDVIEGFTDESMPMGSNMDKQIENINEIIKIARHIDMPVIFTTIAYNETLLDDMNMWRKKMQGLNTLMNGTRAVQVDPRLLKCSEDELIEKKYASAFFGTDLVSLLNSAKIDTLIVTGCTTSGCVRATVVDAIQYGYRPIVVTDAVGDRSQAAHDQSLFDIEQKYGDLVTTKDLIEILSKKTKNTIG